MIRPKLVVTATARSAAEARAEIGTAKQDGADLVEIRLDRWSTRDLGLVQGLFPSPLPLLATYRSRAEGGEGSIEPRRRAAVLRSVRRLDFAYVDRELARDPPPRAGDRARSIGSRHLAAPVDWGTFPEILERGRLEGELPKTIAPATVSEFLHSMLPAVRRDDASGPPAIVLATGPAGALSRVWAARWDCPWVFCASRGSASVAPAPVEESQPPVDRLASVLSGDGSAPLFALLGHPVRHSASPAIHHAWLRSAGMAGLYLTIDVETEREFRDLLPRLTEGGFRGLNVTAPWKRLARTLSDEAEAGAVEAEAVSCLTRTGDRWIGSLTDADALVERLTELRGDGTWSTDSFSVVGSGGAARAALVAARRLGAQVRLWARRPGEARDLETRFSDLLEPASRPVPSLVVHATSVGREGAGELDARVVPAFGSVRYCLDLVYRPEHRLVQQRTEAAGGRYEDGSRLLRIQAAESFRRWFGHPPPGLQEPVP